MAPTDYSYSVPEASLEEQQQEEEEDEAEEIHLRPQLIPQGSGGSGVLMGPDTQKGLENTHTFGYFSLQNFHCGTTFFSQQQDKSPFSKSFLKQIWNSF